MHFWAVFNRALTTDLEWLNSEGGVYKTLILILNGIADIGPKPGLIYASRFDPSQFFNIKITKPTLRLGSSNCVVA